MNRIFGYLEWPSWTCTSSVEPLEMWSSIPKWNHKLDKRAWNQLKPQWKKNRHTMGKNVYRKFRPIWCVFCSRFNVTVYWREQSLNPWQFHGNRCPCKRFQIRIVVVSSINTLSNWSFKIYISHGNFILQMFLAKITSACFIK